MSDLPATPSRGTLIGRGIGRKCPRCGTSAFSGWFRMDEHCKTCGLVFEREEGYWVGAMIINTTITFASFLGVFVLLVAITWPDVPWGLVMAVSIGVNLIIPIVFYPISKSAWLGVEMSYHALEPAEIERARTLATKPEFQ